MAATKVKQLWTAFISVLFALLASVGLASTASAAQTPAVQQPEEPAATPAAGARAHAAVPAQRSAYQGYQWSPFVRERSLPPTIKQRIGAEAHNSSPSVRHLRADAPAENSLTDQTELSGLALASAV